MGDEGRDFKLNFTADARSLVAASKESSAAVSEVGASTEKTTDQTRKLTPAHEEATHAAHKHAGGHKELHKAMHLVMEESPALGLALKAALSPIGGAIMAAVIAFKGVSEQIEEINKELDAMGAEAARGFGKMKESSREATEEIGKQKTAFAHWADNLSAPHNQVMQYLQDEVDKLTEVTEERENLIKARADALKAEVDRKAAMGEMTASEAILRKAQIDQGANAASAANKESRLFTEYDIKKNALRDVAEEGKGIAAGVSELEQVANDKNRATQITQKRKEIADLDAAAEKQEELAKKAQEFADKTLVAARFQMRAIAATPESDIGRHLLGNAAKAQADADAMKATAEKEKEAAEKTRKELEALTETQEEWNHKLEKGKKELEENKNIFDQLTTQVEQLRIKSAGLPARQEADRLRNQAVGSKAMGDIAGTDMGHLLFGPEGGAASAAWHMQHGQKVGGQEWDMLQSLLQSTGAYNKKPEEMRKIIEVLSHAVETPKGQDEAIQMLLQMYRELNQKVRATNSQVRNARNNSGG